MFDLYKKTNETGSILIDTLVAILVCAIVMGSLTPIASQIIMMQSSLISTVNSLIKASGKLW